MRRPSFKKATRRPSLTAAMRSPACTIQESTTFHYFPRLPAEIRLLVWEAAIRDSDEPGAHYFTLFSSHDRLKHGDLIRRAAAPAPAPVPAPAPAPAPAPHALQRSSQKASTNTVPFHVISGAPKLAKAGTEYSWTRENPSAYLAEYGLWHACIESSDVMRKHVHKMRARPENELPFQEPFWRSDEVRQARAMGPSLQVVRFEEDGEEGWLTVSPKQDLFIMRAFSWVDMCRDDDKRWNGLDTIPFMAPQQGGVSHIGFEWDEDYMKCAAGYGFLGRCMAVLNAMHMVALSPRCNYNVWIIDNYLEMTTEAAEELFRRNPRRAVFHANDRTFVELFEEDDDSATLPPRCNHSYGEDERFAFGSQKEFQNMCLGAPGDWDELTTNEQDQQITAAFSLRVAGWVRKG